jgi:hypothetical protein
MSKYYGKGLFVVRSAPKHCPGCGQKILHAHDAEASGHKRDRLMRDWIVFCPAAAAAATPGHDPSIDAQTYYSVRNGRLLRPARVIVL